MSKLPWFKFNPSWWISDTELSKCTPATRGVWIDLLCAMHQSGRSGELSGTTDQIARLARCSTAELTQALTELQTTGTADVTFRNNNVTVINRLMKRESKTRRDTALRVKKHRSNGECNAYETGEKIEDRSKKIEVRKKKASTGRAPVLETSNLYRQPSKPTIDQVQQAFLQRGGTLEQAAKFFGKHESTDWFLNNSPIKNFVSLIPGFIAEWNKRNPETESGKTKMVF
jgi:hypothetical protein